MTNMIDKETLELMRVREQTILDTYNLWSTTIMQKGERLNFLCERDNPSDFIEIEALQKEIEILQRRGCIEEKILKNYQQSRETLLLSNLISGCSSLKL